MDFAVLFAWERQWIDLVWTQDGLGMDLGWNIGGTRDRRGMDPGWSEDIYILQYHIGRNIWFTVLGVPSFFLWGSLIIVLGQSCLFIHVVNKIFLKISHTLQFWFYSFHIKQVSSLGNLVYWRSACGRHGDLADF